MADIRIRFPHHLGTAEAQKRIQTALSNAGVSLPVKLAWNGNQCNISGPVSGSAVVSDDAVVVEVKLGFAMKLMKGKIEENLKSKLEKVLR